MSEIHSRPLSQLARPVKLHSRVLGADLWLVPDEAVNRSYDAPVYTAGECALLLAQRPSGGQLQAVHLIKTMLQGDVTDPAETDGLRQRRDELLAAYHEAAARVDTGSGAGADTDLMRITRQLSHLLCQIDEASSDSRGASAVR